MNLLKNLKVKTKLIGGFFIVAMLIAIVGTVGSASLKNVAKSSEKMYSNNMNNVYMLTDMKQNLTEIKSDMLQLIYVKDLSKRASLEQNIQKNKAENNEYVNNYEKSPMSHEEKNIYEVFKGELDQYITLRENVIKFVNDNNYVEAEKQYKEIYKVREVMFNSLDKIIETNLSSAKSANEDINSIYIKSKISMLIISIVGLLMAILIGIFMSKDIDMPLQLMKLFGEKLANYDFSYDFNIVRDDEFGQTAAALSKAQNNVKELVKIIIENSQDISASSEELSATVEEISSKAVNIDEAVNNIAGNMQESSASTEEISASVEEVDSSINDLSQKSMEGSDNANRAKERATKVKNNSKKAIEEIRKIFAEKKNNMEKVIEDSKVVDNIKVMADTIASIAEQTNLLALNAAIEAARAGEQGRGFAVVAEEVRKLAEQSSEAVSSIQETIIKVQGAFKSSIDTEIDTLNFINKDVHVQFNNYGETGNQYYEDSDFVSKMSEEIAAMSEEITATIGQVTEAVQNMAVTAQRSNEQTEEIKESINETVKAIEQVALTAQNQAELSQKSNEIVQKFKI